MHFFSVYYYYLFQFVIIIAVILLWRGSCTGKLFWVSHTLDEPLNSPGLQPLHSQTCLPPSQLLPLPSGPPHFNQGSWGWNGGFVPITSIYGPLDTLLIIIWIRISGGWECLVPFVLRIGLCLQFWKTRKILFSPSHHYTI